MGKTDVFDGEMPPPLVNSVVAMAFIMKLKESQTVVARKLACNFTADEISDAKDALWNHASTYKYVSVLGDTTSRRGSKNRTGVEADAADVASAMQKIQDAMTRPPSFAIEAIHLTRHLNLLSSVDEGRAETHEMMSRVGSLEGELSCMKKTMREIAEGVEHLLHHQGRMPGSMPDVSDCNGPGHSSSQAISSRSLFQPTAPQQFWETEETLQKQPESGSGRLMSDVAAVAAADPDGFVEVKKVRKPRPPPKQNAPRRQVQGKRTQLPDGCRFRGAPVPQKSLFISRVEKETTLDDLTSYINDLRLDVKVDKIELISHVNARCNSFRLDLSARDFEKLMNPDLWPDNTCVRRFHWPRSSGTESVKAPAADADAADADSSPNHGK